MCFHVVIYTIDRCYQGFGKGNTFWSVALQLGFQHNGYYLDNIYRFPFRIDDIEVLVNAMHSGRSGFLKDLNVFSNEFRI